MLRLRARSELYLIIRLIGNAGRASNNYIGDEDYNYLRGCYTPKIKGPSCEVKIRRPKIKCPSFYSGDGIISDSDDYSPKYPSCEVKVKGPWVPDNL